MLNNLRNLSARLAQRGFSSSVKIAEHKVKVGNHEINYVHSSLEGANQNKNLICVPGALGILLSLIIFNENAKLIENHFPQAQLSLILIRK